MNELVNIRCVNCGVAIPQGQPVCPWCFPQMGGAVARPAPMQGSAATVPVRLALPRNMGGMEARVSRSTANSIASAVTGGLLVALGVIVPAVLGLWPRKPSRDSAAER